MSLKRLGLVGLVAVAPLLAQLQPDVSYPTFSATTPPLGLLIQQSMQNPGFPVVPSLGLDHPGPIPVLPPATGPDPLLNIISSGTFKATPGINILGNGNTFPGFTVGVEPSDTNGSAGTTQYVQWVNTSFTIFNKSGAVIAGPSFGNSLWSSLGAGSICSTTNSGDIVVTFDKANSRWVFTQFAITAAINGQYAECVAVSNSSDATGTFNVYEYDFTDFPDYPKMGIWSDAYYITYNMFSHTTGGFLNAKSCAYDGAAMRAGSASPTQVCFNLPAGVDSSVLPSDIDGSTAPPSGAPNPQFELFNSANHAMWNFHVDFVTTANSTYTGRTLLPVTSFNFVCNNFSGGSSTCVSQPGTTQLLDTLGNRLMFRAAYRNRSGIQSVLLTHTVDATGPPNDINGVRWYEFRVTESTSGGPYTATVYQQATQSPTTTEHRWMPSIAMDKVGNIMLGYSVSNGSTVFPSVRITGRTRTEPRGFMETEQTIVAGTGSQIGHSRWGDYSTMSIDPVDDCTFWYTQEYFDAPSGDFAWKTRIASFKFANCQ